MPPQRPSIGPALAPRLMGGVAIVVATRDESLRPQIARAWGPQLEDGGTALRICVGATAGSQTLANLRSNRAIAVTFSRPTTYRTIQAKGLARALSAPTAGDLERVEEHFAAFSDEVAPLGISRVAARRLLLRELTAVTVDVGELYEQTPGPSAGAAL